MTSIATMPAGQELDALVARVLGVEYRLSATTTDWTTSEYLAMRALHMWREQHPGWSIDIDFNPPCHPGRWECCLYNIDEDAEITAYEAHDETLALAICRAIAMAGEGQSVGGVD